MLTINVAPRKPSNFTNVCMGGGGGGASLFPPLCKGVTLYSNIFACFQGITFNTRHFSLFCGALSSIVNGCSLTGLYQKKKKKTLNGLFMTSVMAA